MLDRAANPQPPSRAERLCNLGLNTIWSIFSVLLYVFATVAVLPCYLCHAVFP